MGLDLEPDDFRWTTDIILDVASKCCDGRVVSVLEGGYGEYVNMPKEVAAASGIRVGLKRDNLARNCAAHLTAMCGL